jgi:hypothetical protein
VLEPYEILEIANAQQGKKQFLYWHLLTGTLMKARVVKVLNAQYILVKERRLFGSLAKLIDLNSVSSRVSVSRSHSRIRKPAAAAISFQR